MGDWTSNSVRSKPLMYCSISNWYVITNAAEPRTDPTSEYEPSIIKLHVVYYMHPRTDMMYSCHPDRIQKLGYAPLYVLTFVFENNAVTSFPSFRVYHFSSLVTGISIGVANVGPNCEIHPPCMLYRHYWLFDILIHVLKIEVSRHTNYTDELGQWKLLYTGWLSPVVAVWPDSATLWFTQVWSSSVGLLQQFAPRCLPAGLTELLKADWTSVSPSN